MQLMLFNLFSPALKLNTGLAILSPGAFEVHSDGIDVDNELFHYPIKKAYTPYNIHTYKTEEVVNQRNIKVKEGANKQVISSQADSLIKISRIWADFFPANTSNQPI